MSDKLMKKFEQMIETDYGQLQARGFGYSDGNVVMYFMDIPGAMVEGKSVEEAIEKLKGGLEAILDMFVQNITN